MKPTQSRGKTSLQTEVYPPKKLVGFFEKIAEHKTKQWLQEFLGVPYTSRSCEFKNVFLADSLDGFAQVFLTMQAEGTLHSIASLKIAVTFSAKGWLILISTEKQHIFNKQSDWMKEAVVKGSNEWHQTKFGRPIEIYQIAFPALCEDGSIAWNVRYYSPLEPGGLIHCIFVFVTPPGLVRTCELLDCEKAF